MNIKCLELGICKSFLQKNNVKYEITMYQTYLLYEIFGFVNELLTKNIELLTKHKSWSMYWILY